MAGKEAWEIALYNFTAAFNQHINVNTANASMTSPAWGLLVWQRGLFGVFKKTEGPETPNIVSLDRSTKTEKEVGVCSLAAQDILSFPLRENLANQWR